MNRILRTVLSLLLVCTAAHARRHTAFEPVFFDASEAAPQTLQAPADDADAPAPAAATDAPEAQEAVPEEAVHGEIAPSVPDPEPETQNVAERTGAIHYAPALDAETTAVSSEARRFRFELGIRSMGAWLTDDRQGKPFDGSFVGSIYKIKAKQNWVPIHPYAQLSFALPGGLWLGAGATYSHLDVETLDDGGGDGDIESDLVMGYVLLEYPVARLRPYAEAGYGRAFNTFDADASWSAGGRREFVLEDSPAWMAGGGIGLAVTERFTVDAHVRYVHFDVDGTYEFRGDSRPDTDFTFTPSYVAAGIGVSYAL